MGDIMANGTFEVELQTEEVPITGMEAIAVSKVFSGDLVGSSEGRMLSAGDPAAGSAGYVALEVVTGSIGERVGTFALQQSGTMHAGNQDLTWLVVPGSGRGDFVGITGRVDLAIDDGVHRYELAATIPEQ